MQRYLLLLLALILGSAACSNRTGALPNDAGSAQVASSSLPQRSAVPESLVDSAISPNIVGPERQITRELIRQIAAVSPLFRQTLVLNPHGKIVIVDLQGRIHINDAKLNGAFGPLSSVANRPNAFRYPSGQIVDFPVMQPMPRMLGRSRPNLTQRSLHPLIFITPNPGTGPYRRIYTYGGYYGEAANISLPCSTHYMAPTDTGYIYMGGWGDDGSQEGFGIDAGLQYSSTFFDYAPFIRFANSPTPIGPTLWSANHNGYLRWTCGQTIGMAFSANADPALGTTDFFLQTHAGGLYLDTNGNYQWSNLYDYIDVAIQQPGVPWNGWGAGPYSCSASSSCILKFMTSIAQPSDSFLDQSSFQNIGWGLQGVATYHLDVKLHMLNTNNTQSCENYPTWTANPFPFDGCNNSPSYYTNIQVSNFNLGTESVTVDLTQINDPKPTPTPRPTSNPIPTRPPPKCPPSACGGSNAPLGP